eukprot:scaffold8864_cov122-Isochrysis_galbana.AAC.7
MHAHHLHRNAYRVRPLFRLAKDSSDGPLRRRELGVSVLWRMRAPRPPGAGWAAHARARRRCGRTRVSAAPTSRCDASPPSLPRVVR